MIPGNRFNPSPGPGRHSEKKSGTSENAGTGLLFAVAVFCLLQAGLAALLAVRANAGEFDMMTEDLV